MEADPFASLDTRDAHEAIAEVVAAFEDGDRPHVAVVGPPFAGRAALLDYAADCLGDAERVAFASGIEPPVGLPDANAVVVDNCQYLYTRTVDGYGAVESFAEELADGERLFVTGWNEHAWSYLAAIRNVDDLFAVTVEVPTLSADEIETVLTEGHEGPLPEFAESDPADRPGAEQPEIPLPGDRSVALPRLSVDRVGDAIGDDTPEERRQRVFDTITAESMGNAGVARALWEASIEDGSVSPASVRGAVPGVSMDDETAFTLRAVLTNERIERDRLRAVVGERRYSRSLRLLRHQDLVTTDGSTVAMKPVAVPGAAAFLTRRRLVW